MKLILNDDFAFDCKTAAVGRDGDVGAVEVVADFGAADKRYEAVRFEFADMLGKRFRTKTFPLNNNPVVRFPLPGEVTDTTGTVELQAVLTGQNVVRKTNVLTLEVLESVNAEDAEVVGGWGMYCPIMQFGIDENGELRLVHTDESGAAETRTELREGGLVTELPDRYGIAEFGITEGGEAFAEIIVEEK